MDTKQTSALYAAIAGVTSKYTFTSPVEVADIEHVRAELLGALPSGYGVEIYHTHEHVCVKVYDNEKTRVYDRTMLVTGYVRTVKARV